MTDALTREIQHLIGNWLERSDWTTQELIGWLQGFELPSARYEDEPFRWLLRGVPLAGDRFHAEREFARRVASLLNERPDVECVGRRPNELLYNLLELCAALSVPDHLADPLWEMFGRRALKGIWRGVDLRISLRRALTTNQRDSRLEFVWQEMLSGKGHPWLLGDHYDGFEGVRLKPTSAATRGEPDTDAIGCALAAMSAHIKADRGCRIEFGSLVSRILGTYPGRPSWHAELIEQADDKKFPTWAVSALPSLFVRVPAKDEVTTADACYLLWNVFVPILKGIDKPFAVEKTLCDEGIVLQVRISKDAEMELALASSLIEQRRLSNPYKSYRTVVQSSYESLITENGAVKADSISESESNMRRALSKEEMALYRQSIISDEPRVLSQAACAGASSSQYVADGSDERG